MKNAGFRKDLAQANSHRFRRTAQMIRYLTITALELALLNFKNARLEWKRVVREGKRDSVVPDLHG